MSDNAQQFRSATFGGFQKQDVLDYIERSTREHSEKLEALQKELEEVKAAKATLESGTAELNVQLENTSTQLKEAAAAVEWANAEMGKKDALLTQLGEENTALKDKVTLLEPDAEAYRKVKDRTAGIELEAHCRAQAAEAAAQEHIAKTKAEVEQWILKVRGGYDRLRTDVDATLSHAMGELESVNKTLGGISGEFSSRDAELEKLLEQYRQGQGPKAPVPLDVE